MCYQRVWNPVQREWENVLPQNIGQDQLFATICEKNQMPYEPLVKEKKKNSKKWAYGIPSNEPNDCINCQQLISYLRYILDILKLSQSN